jgi:2-polyprenyl-3-methyl-5-hydroxy-6-metoxy-1,4-benzoquinol methylase
MSKYNFELDMNSNNSNSTILRNIVPNSKVLEIGCAHGRMTKYMKQALNCSVDTIEIDEEAGKVAAQWANKSFAGNIEDLDIWDDLESMGCTNYDYIIFADVLEHLHDPERILNSSKRVLNDNGSIWVSIPNVAHNAVLIDLFNDKFTYRDVGLLDNTHIKLFTYLSLEDMISRCGLSIVTKINLQSPLAYTEFQNSYEDLPPEVAKFIKAREFGEIYQFVWELEK